MTDVREELLPCPFCGGRTSLRVPGEHDGFAAHVSCRCGAQLFGNKHHFGSESEAASAWNTRALASRGVPEGFVMVPVAVMELLAEIDLQMVDDSNGPTCSECVACGESAQGRYVSGRGYVHPDPFPHNCDCPAEFAKTALTAPQPAGEAPSIYDAYMTWPEDIRRKLSMHDLRRMSGWAPPEPAPSAPADATPERIAMSQMKHAATRAHAMLYVLACKHPEIAELQDDGLLHKAVHEIIAIDTPGYVPGAHLKTATDAEVEAWANRHGLDGWSATDRRAAFEDAQSWIVPAPACPATADVEALDWITDDMSGIQIVDQVRIQAQFSRIEDDEIVRALEVAIRRLSGAQQTRPAPWNPPSIPADTDEAAMVVIERDAQGKPTVWCDPEIVDLVGALNTRSLRTVASCSGHGGPFGFIILADGRELLILPDYESARFAERALGDAFKARQQAARGK